MKRKLYLFVILTLFAGSVFAQTFQINGVVKDDKGQPLPGVSVLVKGTTRGTTTNTEGKYSIRASKGETLQFSYIGFNTQTVKVGDAHTIDIVLKSGVALNEVVVTGTRFAGRTAIETPVPVDIINIKSIQSVTPQVSLNQMLNYAAPSFTSNTQTISDGTDEVDPASLRGLGPDQVLVLIDGKRRHPSSLINVNGTFGRGNVGTDMNTIPAAAISNIQILRDGASAQYGSDAIAGVINIILSKSTGKLAVNVTSGAHFTKNANYLTGGVDGPMTNVSVNYGIALGKRGGFINMTGEFNYRNYFSRMGDYYGKIFNGYNAVEWNAHKAGVDIAHLTLDQIRYYAQQSSVFDAATKAQIAAATTKAQLQNLLKGDVTNAELLERGLTRRDFAMRVGQSALRGGKIFFNMAVPVDRNGTSFYAYGGSNYRKGDAAGFYRLPYQNRTYTPIYINGFLPQIQTDIKDNSLTFGIKGLANGWNIDFSNTWGKNSMFYTVAHSLNASMQSASKTSFNSGGFSFMQNTTNLDIDKQFGNILSGVSVAYGGEFSLENYQIYAGEVASYATYDTALQVVTRPWQVIPTDFFGSPRPGGAQVFPGFRPGNEVNKYRSSVAAYADVETNFSKSLLVDVAARFENYSDFGSTFNWKIATRLKASQNLNLRASVNTGFRAPSLQQIYFNSTSTLFVDGIPYEVGLFANDSKVAKALGIPKLKQETSQAFSVGFTGKVPQLALKITVDGYMVWIQNRIVLTGTFKATTPQLVSLFRAANATRAAFFANAIDTRSEGIDIVLENNLDLSPDMHLKNSLTATFSRTKQIGSIHASKILEQSGQASTYFDQRSRIFLEDAVPHTKINLSNTLTYNKMVFFLRNVYFGKVTNPTNTPANMQVYGAKIITDLSIGYKMSKSLEITIGANNLFDIYPDKNIAANTSSGRFIYPRAALQFGIGGRFIFGRMIFKL